MDTNNTYTRRVLPDQRTGKLPTDKQLEVLLCLNPIKNKVKTYREVADELGITINSVKSRMKGLKLKCPTIYKNFRKIRFKKRKKRKKIYKTGCRHCGCDLPTGQDMCFRCWRKNDRKENPQNYQQHWMFPANGKTVSKVEADIFEERILRDDWGY